MNPVAAVAIQDKWVKDFVSLFIVIKSFFMLKFDSLLVTHPAWEGGMFCIKKGVRFSADPLDERNIALELREIVSTGISHHR